ncbi:Heterokaryon incompatibility protein [Fusarium heterosporum]|uniref:Heterokaryon incompatibility protein n=1 Tax=Fusarium heterosporum TaxID=42747 RepID=A0A8H5WI69_FUSHE|nr:Heterokaryon incompatibility protein [Fusarium heterosporum]
MSHAFPAELMAEATGRPTSIKANEPPGHDIFCTPENSEFLSKVPYDDFNTTGREIRLLKILPDSGSGFVECELLPSMELFSLWRRYHALSYCAGDARNTKAILVNGVRCNVFANLHHALTVVRHHWKTRHQQQELLLWVDQICINQANLAERSHQVGFMRDIYRYAEQTFICLSTTRTEGQGLKWLSELWRTMIEDSLWTQTTGEPLREYLRMKFTEKSFMKGLAGFFDVLRSPWWERAWVFQEFIVSSLPTFLLGYYAISLPDLAGLLPELCTVTLEILFGPDSIRKRQFLQELRHTRHKPSQVREAITVVLRMLLAATEWRKTSDLKLLLMYTQKSQASDCRDKIYSMIGLVYPGYGIVPNYSTENSPARLLMETTRRIITFENNLEVLSYIRHGSSRSENEVTLPSWVVDWFRNDNTPVVCSVKGIEKVTIGGFKFKIPSILTIGGQS